MWIYVEFNWVFNNLKHDDLVEVNNRDSHRGVLCLDPLFSWGPVDNGA